MRVLMLALWAFEMAAPAQSLDDLAAERALAKFQSYCDAQGRALWGRSLCGPIVIVNPQTHWTVASEQDPEHKFAQRGAVYVGALPDRVDVANTAFDWGNRKWTMVRSPLPADPFAQVSLLSHEAFHRIQEAADLAGSDQPNAHLDTEKGRLWFRLELRALARALRAESEVEMRRCVADALLFRTQRYALFPGARQHEAAMERQEGLAEYTGTVIAFKETGEVVSRLARRVEAFEDQDAHARSFAYSTGPAIGLLLDRLNPEWRKRVSGGATLEGQLIEATGFKLPPGLAAVAETNAAAYGFKAVAAAEQAREVRHQELLDTITRTFVDGPTLRFPEQRGLNRAFNPYELVPFGALGTFYPTGTFRADWGKLQVDSVGAILSANDMAVRVAAPTDPAARPVKGPGWTLELEPGWSLRPIAGSAGSFEVFNAGSAARP